VKVKPHTKYSAFATIAAGHSCRSICSFFFIAGACLRDHSVRRCLGEYPASRIIRSMSLWVMRYWAPAAATTFSSSIMDPRSSAPKNRASTPSTAAIDSAFIYNIDFLSWELNNEADFIIYVSLPVETLFLLNSFPIFLGLVLIPASGLYLVHGGKEAMNTTKLYYVLVVFFIGWALLIGGIIS